MTPYQSVIRNGAGDRRPVRCRARTLGLMAPDLLALAGPLMASSLLYPLLAGLSSLDGILPLIPSEAVILSAGVFAHGGTPNLWLVIAATAVGVFFGDHLAYGLSRSFLGPRLIRRSTHISRAVGAASPHLDRHALLLIVASRFVSGGRVTMNLASGTARLPLCRFSPASAIAALAWAAYIAGLGYLGGAAFVENPLIAIAIGLGLSVLLGGLLDLVRRTGRRKDLPEGSAVPSSWVESGTGRPPHPTQRQARTSASHVPGPLTAAAGRAGARASTPLESVRPTTGTRLAVGGPPTCKSTNLLKGGVDMKRVLSVLMAATTALAVVAAPAAANAAPENADGVTLQGRLDDVVAAGAVGALAQVRHEHGVWRGTSGVAELDTTRKVPVHGRFRAGSITKTFIATVVLQLAGEGRLRLDDPVDVWLPGAVPDGHRITVRHLLSHTSGLYDWLHTLPFPPTREFLDNRWRTWTPTELIQRAVANPPTFEPPGSAYRYSNTGYTLLGQIVEQVTGRSYDVEIGRRIIRPLQLRGTWLPGTSPRIPGPHPHGYVPVEQDGGPAQLLDYTHMNPSVLGAGGELISTSGDLNRFFAALLSGQLLTPALLDEMRTPGVEGSRYGLGLAWRDASCGVRVYGNDGDALTYQSWSFSTWDRRRQVTIALTPDFREDPDDAVDAFLDEVFCG